MRARLRFRVRQARYHLTRRRYWRRMRGPLPRRDQGVPYDRQAWLAILDAYDARPARTVRTRT
jgi:hypothetical protein